MALEAVRELLEYYIAVRLAMAFLALRNSSVFCVAFCAGNLAVLTGGCSDFVVYRTVASPAYIILRRLWIRYLQRVVGGMTGQTLFIFLSL